MVLLSRLSGREQSERSPRAPSIDDDPAWTLASEIGPHWGPSSGVKAPDPAPEYAG